MNDEKRFEGESKDIFFDSNFAAYEEWRSQALGYAAKKPLRITAS